MRPGVHAGKSASERRTYMGAVSTFVDVLRVMLLVEYWGHNEDAWQSREVLRAFL